LWWKVGHGCSTSSLMDPSALDIFNVERSFIRAQHSCWVAISGTLHVASDPTVYSPSAFDQAPNSILGFPSAQAPGTKFFRHLMPVRFLPSPCSAPRTFFSSSYPGKQTMIQRETPSQLHRIMKVVLTRIFSRRNHASTGNY